MFKHAEYTVLPNALTVFLTDGRILKHVYLAKLPSDAHFHLALRLNGDALEVIDIADDEILGAVDSEIVKYEC